MTLPFEDRESGEDLAGLAAEAEALALGDEAVSGEWSEGLAGEEEDAPARFDAFGDERDSEWASESSEEMQSHDGACFASGDEAVSDESSEGFAGEEEDAPWRFDAFGDERDSEWASESSEEMQSHDNAGEELERPLSFEHEEHETGLAGSGLTPAEQKAETTRGTGGFSLGTANAGAVFSASEYPGQRFPPTRAALGQTTTARRPKTLTPQQKRWPCDATPPTCMTPAVSTGQFGVALQRFTDERCVNSKVPILLKKSAKFMARVATLDRKYLALDGEVCRRSTPGDWWTAWAPDANGVLTKGPFPGRRVLTMLYSATGSLFLPSNAVDNGYGYDLIVIKLPDGIGPDGKPHSGGSASSPDVLVQWISAIAHETVHAHTFVTATGVPPATIPLRVAAAITEEAATRALEATILNEIAATADGAFRRAAVKGVAGSTVTSRVQRDFFPGEDRATYLEHFVLTERMLDAIRREKLKPADIARIDKEIDAIDLTLRQLDKNLTDPFPIYYDPGVPAGKAGSGVSSKALFKTIATEYGKFRFWRRVIAARWKALEKRLGGMPAQTDPVREKVVQVHEKALFGGLVRYDALPASTSKAKARELESLSANSVAEESEDVVHRSRRPPESGGGGAAAASLDPGNFRQFVDTNRLDLEIAHVLNVLDHYPEGSWAKQSASFAHHELVANNLLALVKGSNSRRAADQIPTALRATEVPRVELNASGLGPNLLAVTVADIGAPNTFSGYILVEDDLVRNGTQPGPGRKKLALTLVHELSHIRNRVQTKKDIPEMRRDTDTFIRPGDADAAIGAAEFFEEMVAKHIEWRVLKDIEHKWDGKPIPTGHKPRGLFQFALMMPLTRSDMSPARTTYLTRLATSPNPHDYDRQVGLWLRLIASQALFHDSPTINDTVRRQFLDEFNLAQPDFRNPGVNPDGGVFFGKPTASENESDEAQIAAESEMADDAHVILGKWTVRLKDWVWEYEFSAGGNVTWRDTRSSEKGVGRWTLSPKAINISWSGSATKEGWVRPLTPARQSGWYQSTYYTGSYQVQKVGAAARGGPSTPVPAWADAIDPFPASVTVGLDRSNASMTTEFAPVTVSTANHLCAALADVTGGGASAPFAALRENEMVYVGSLLKVGVMYAAFALRNRVQAFADAARANGVTTAAELFSLIRRAWTPKLKALFPARSTQSFGNNQDVTVPQVDRIFTLSATGKIEFAMASPAITVADLDRAGEFGAPIGLFHEWMRLMMRWSNNAAASRCVLALGYFYINGLFARSGFFNAGQGLWLSGDYAGHDWVRTATERSANAAGVALDPRWATAQGRTKSNFVGNALQVGRLMTAMAQDTLVDAGACAEMRRLASQLSGGIGSYAGSALNAVGRRQTALSSKIGFGDDRFSHDCAIVERTVGSKRLRYAAVVLGSAPAQRRRDLSDLFVLLDAVVVARNP